MNIDTLIFKPHHAPRWTAFMCPLTLYGMYTDIALNRCFFTVHCLVTVHIGNKQNTNSIFNWRLWKINTALLKYEQFVAIVSELLKEVGETDIGLIESWEIFKENVKLATTEKSSNIKYQFRARKRQLQRNLVPLPSRECKSWRRH